MRGGSNIKKGEESHLRTRGGREFKKTHVRTGEDQNSDHERKTMKKYSFASLVHITTKKGEGACVFSREKPKGEISDEVGTGKKMLRSTLRANLKKVGAQKNRGKSKKKEAS